MASNIGLFGNRSQSQPQEPALEHRELGILRLTVGWRYRALPAQFVVGAKRKRKSAKDNYLFIYHSMRCRPEIPSKCRSRLSKGREYLRQMAAIHMSFDGIGLPFFFSSRPISA